MATPNYMTPWAEVIPGHRPVYKAANGAFYHLLVTKDRVRMYKATSLSSSWALEAGLTYTEPTGGKTQYISSDMTPDSTKVVVFFAVSDGGSNAHLRMAVYNTTTDTFSEISTNTTDLLNWSQLAFFEGKACAGNSEAHGLFTRGGGSQHQFYAAQRTYGGGVPSIFGVSTSPSYNAYGLNGEYQQAFGATYIGCLLDENDDAAPGGAVDCIPGRLSGTTATTRSLRPIPTGRYTKQMPASNLVHNTADPYPPYPASETGFVLLQADGGSGTHGLIIYDDFETNDGSGYYWSEHYELDLGVTGKWTVGGQKAEAALLEHNGVIHAFIIGADNKIYWGIRNGMASFTPLVAVYEGTDPRYLSAGYVDVSGDFSVLVFQDWDGSEYVTYNLPVDLNSPPLIASSVPSGEAFGQSTLQTKKNLSPTGIPSSQAFGVPKLNRKLPAGTITSAQAFGTAKVNRNAKPATITSQEAVAAPALLVQTFLQPTGLASTEGVGALTLIQEQFLTLTGIAGAEAFGELTMTRFYRAIGIGSEEGFGTAVVQAGVSFIDTTGIVAGELGQPTLNFRLQATPANSGESMGEAQVQATYSIQASGFADPNFYGEPSLRFRLYTPSVQDGETFGSAKMESRVVVPSLPEGGVVGGVRLSTAQKLPILVQGIIF